MRRHYVPLRPGFAAALIFLFAAVASAETFEHRTPFYRIVINSDPVRVESLAWDLSGASDYREIAVGGRCEGSGWASTLYAGQGSFTNHLAGPAARAAYDKAGGTLTLEGIALLPGLTADWRFEFHADYFQHAIVWHAGQDIPNVLNLGHQWLGHLDNSGDEVSAGQRGDQPGFSRYVQLFDDRIAFRESLVTGSTELTGNRYFHGAGALWQNIFTPGGATIPPGAYPGGRWYCRALPPEESHAMSQSNHIGRYINEGEYFKDFFFLKHDGRYHLLYNVGKAGPTQDWQDPGNEEAFGYATSADLNTWQPHGPVFRVRGEGWEGKTISAPSIVRVGDWWMMVYTGFDKRAQGCQRIGAARSRDLVNWERLNDGEPVYEGSAWTNWKAGQWADCRDAHIIREGDAYLMYTMVTTAEGRGAIAIAESDDLVNWTDLGPAHVYDGIPESPVVIQRNGWYYLMTGASAQICVRSRDPRSNQWEQIPFEYPGGNLWSAWEIVEENDAWVFAAFEWKMMGNNITFWELRWDGDRPYIRF